MVARSLPVAQQRLFFALVPDPPVLKKIENVQRKLKIEHRIEARAVKANQFHVTLAFLGNQPIDQLQTLLDLGSSLHMPACSVRLDRLGRFRRAGVVWLGATTPPAELLAFQARLVAALECAGIAFDRKPWKFHLTLYRDLRTPWVNMDPDTVSWDLNGFSLVESISINRGVEYRQLGRWSAG
jgi:2'-5' RNA ligase